jgi:hypothetical protein
MSIIDCAYCNDDIDTDVDNFYGSEIDGFTYCETCHHSDMEHASTALMAGPDYPHDSEGAIRIYVGDWFIEDRWGEVYNDIEFEREYKASDAWRGHYETRIKGWTEVLSGWTTGGWGDSTAERKQAFNTWAENLYTGEKSSPVNVALITDPTSNVFSTAIGVFVAEEDADTFTTWVNGELDNLRYALS